MKKFLALLLAAMMLTGLLAGCGGDSTEATNAPATQPAGESQPAEESQPAGETQPQGTTTEGPQYGGHLNVRITAMPTGVDPLKQTGAFKYLYMTAVYEPVLTRDAENNIAPSVCDFEISEDLLDLKLWVREGVTFSNGDAADIYDVEASINRFISQYANGKKYVKPYISSMTVEQENGKDILHIVFSSYHEKTLYYLAAYQTWCAVLPKEICEKYATSYIVADLEDAIGTGPYVFTDMEDSVHITIKKRDNYVPVESNGTGMAGTKYGYLDSMTFWYNATDASSAVAMLAGEYDVTEVIPADYEQMARDQGLTVSIMPSNQHTFIIFNTRGSDNMVAKYPSLRKAILAAIDYEEFLAVVCDDSQVLEGENSGFILQDKYDTDAFKKADYYGPDNQELVDKYLKDAEAEGYKGGPVQIVYNASRTDIPTLLCDYMDKAGINFQLQTFENATASAFVGDPSNNWDFTFQWQTVAFTPSLLTDSIMDSHYKSDWKDETREKMAQMDPDSEEYMQLWQELAQYTADGAYFGALSRIDWWWWHPQTFHVNDDGYSRFLYNAYWDDPANHPQK